MVFISLLEVVYAHCFFTLLEFDGTWIVRAGIICYAKF